VTDAVRSARSPAQQTGQVTVGVNGMGVSATFDHLDYVAPDAP
jgi:hypothetical protein